MMTGGIRYAEGWTIRVALIVAVLVTASDAAFAKKHGLPLPLLADMQGEVTARYGSILNSGLAKFAKRNTFLIDPDGRIAKVCLSASGSRNSAEVIEDLKKFKGS
jgi:thioredoxin-dependent peroxiredoxin